MRLSPKELGKLRSFFTDKPVIKAYLFGSFARGEANAESDVDILLELDEEQHVGLGFIAIKYELEDLLKRKVDLVSSRGLSKYISPTIEVEKSLIYAR